MGKEFFFSIIVPILKKKNCSIIWNMGGYGLIREGKHIESSCFDKIEELYDDYFDSGCYGIMWDVLSSVEPNCFYGEYKINMYNPHIE